MYTDHAHWTPEEAGCSTTRCPDCQLSKFTNLKTIRAPQEAMRNYDLQWFLKGSSAGDNIYSETTRLEPLSKLDSA